MGWSFTTEVEAYAEHVLPLLTGAPDEHCAALGVIAEARARTVGGGAELFGWWTDEAGHVTGGVSVSPPDPPLMEVIPEPALGPLIEHLRDMNHGPIGATGPSGLAVSFAARAARLLGLTPRLDQVMVQYRAKELKGPIPLPSGRARPATESDVGLLREWVKAVAQETTTSHSDATDAHDPRDDLLDGSYHLWEDPDGRVVALAGHTQPAWGVTRVGPVYTPPQARGRGYATAVTYSVTATLLDQGLTAVLFTDLASPAPNRLYRRLGYEPMAQWLSLTLS